MGWLERNDLLNWIDLIVSSDADARILLYGGSMGAATVMMTTGDPRLPRNVVSAIVDSGYTSARMVFIDNLRHSSHLPKPLAAACVDATGLFCKTLCRVRFFGSHLSAVAQTYRHSGAVHPWRTGRHRELTFPQDQLRKRARASIGKSSWFPTHAIWKHPSWIPNCIGTPSTPSSNAHSNCEP